MKAGVDIVRTEDVFPEVSSIIFIDIVYDILVYVKAYYIVCMHHGLVSLLGVLVSNNSSMETVLP